MELGEDELIKKYKLSSKEHNEILEIIKQVFLKNVKPVENPIGVIVGAQPRIRKRSINRIF